MALTPQVRGGVALGTPKAIRSVLQPKWSFNCQSMLINAGKKTPAACPGWQCTSWSFTAVEVKPTLILVLTNKA